MIDGKQKGKMHLDYRIISSAILFLRSTRPGSLVLRCCVKVGTRVTQSVRKESGDHFRLQKPTVKEPRFSPFSFSTHSTQDRIYSFPPLIFFSFLGRCHRHGTCKTSCPSLPPPPPPPLPFSSDGIHLKITGAGSFPAQIKEKEKRRKILVTSARHAEDSCTKV